MVRRHALTFAMAAFLLFQPAFDVLWHRLILPVNHERFDSHGDITRDLLDYLENIEAKRVSAPALAMSRFPGLIVYRGVR